MNLSKFDHHITPETKRQWVVLFCVCIAILIVMYFSGFDDVEIGSQKFYFGLVICFLFGVLGIGLGRGLNVWYTTQYRDGDADG